MNDGDWGGKKDEGVSNIMLAHPLLVLFAGLVRAVIRVGARR